MKKVLASQNAPKAVGPYSHAVQAGDFIYASGQLPVNPATGEFAGSDIAAMTLAALGNLEAVLREGGCTRKNVVKTTIFLTDLRDFEKVNAAYAEFFTGCDYPARSTVQVAGLPKGSPVEIEAVAYKPA